MKRICTLALCAVALLFALSAHAQMTPYTKSFLERYKEKNIQANGPSKLKGRFVKTQKNAQNVETIECFVRLTEHSVEAIEACGGVINSQLRDLAIVTMPVERIEELAGTGKIRQIDVSRPLRLKSDQARVKVKAEDVQTLSAAAQAAGLTQKYDGSGVILGIIDDGIEFNHLAFKTSSGATRLIAAYLPNATVANGGIKKTIEGNTLSGYAYETPTAIGRLTTDDTSESHGTHTTGCAAGSRITTTGLSPNVTYGGMACAADLVLCGCGNDLSNTAVANSALYIANWAREKGQPCVISISLGDNQGPHDGTSETSEWYDSIAEEYGAVILLAAGNEGECKFYASKTLSSDNDYLGTILGLSPDNEDEDDHATTLSSVDIWNSTNDPLEVQFVVVDEDGDKVWESDKMSSGSISAATLRTYFNNTGFQSYWNVPQKVTVQSSSTNSNGRFNLYVEANLGPAKTEGNKFGMLVYGKAGNTIHMWNSPYDASFETTASSTYHFVAGDASASICDDVTGKHTISVGAWCSRLDVPFDYGQDMGSLSNAPFVQDDIASFSSYGPDYSGVQHPFITAPGHTVISSINRYDTAAWEETLGASEAAYRKRLNTGGYDYWKYMSGTSMATPVAAGVVALYLQANPRLDVAGVKDVISHSADTDSYTTGTHSIRFGQGKINALKGIKYILESTGINDIEIDRPQGNGKVYNLMGQELATPQRGINIINGRKVLIP